MAEEVPAWRRVTEGESRVAVSIAVVVALLLQRSLPDDIALHPRWLLPVVAGVLVVVLLAANTRQPDRRTPALRVGSMTLIGVLSVANAWAGYQLVDDLLHGRVEDDASRLLLTGGAIWLTNVIAFALWYWELDRGGPAHRAAATKEHLDFSFPQMQNPELAPTSWEPEFVDYLYLSFTNSTAFSPTDVLPLSRWAKLTMLFESIVSFSTVILVVARAVNTLR